MSFNSKPNTLNIFKLAAPLLSFTFVDPRAHVFGHCHSRYTQSKGSKRYATKDLIYTGP